MSLSMFFLVILVIGLVLVRLSLLVLDYFEDPDNIDKDI